MKSKEDYEELMIIRHSDGGYQLQYTRKGAKKTLTHELVSADDNDAILEAVDFLHLPAGTVIDIIYC